MDVKEKRISEINQLIKKWQTGDKAARNNLFNRINAEVEKIASIVLRRNQSPLTFITGDLANEAFVKLLQRDQLHIKDHAHMLALCARIMRFIIVDRTRQKMSLKHGGNLVTLCTEQSAQDDNDIPALELDSVLTKLSAINPDRAKIVEMRYFGGMTYDEIASVMDISATTVKRSWRATRGWLKDALDNDAA
ncbi:MAG: ECF-type sigma factor [Pseudomonadota bacterium]